MMYGVSAGTKKLNLICTKILNQETFNQGSNVLYFHSHTVKPRPGQTVSGKGLLCIPCYKHTLRTWMKIIQYLQGEKIYDSVKKCIKNDLISWTNHPPQGCVYGEHVEVLLHSQYLHQYIASHTHTQT